MAEKMEGQSGKPEETKKAGGYGKRPLWQYVLLYIIIGGLLYFAVYYFFFHKSGYNYGGSSNGQTQTAPGYSY